MGKIVKMVMVTASNNNKYYFMFEQNDGTFNVEYGRVDSTKQHASYPMSKWSLKYNEKIKKGYKDITELYTINENTDKKNSGETFISNDTFVKQLIEDLRNWANQTIASNYKVSTSNVTKKMVDEAQLIIDELSKAYRSNYTVDDLNELLLKLFTVIPRKMGNVRDYMVNTNNSNDSIGRLISDEQSILDALAGQVAMQEPEKNSSEEDTIKTTSLLESMGVEVKHVTDLDTVSKVKKLMGDSSNLFYRLYEVVNKKTEKRYNECMSKMSIKKEELLWHGSRNQNWWSIALQTGMLIRPSGVILTGSMYGNGAYFSSKCRKSIGYTSLSGSYWAGGNATKSYLALFKVNVGNKKIVTKHDSSCYSFDKNNILPYNSVHAPAGVDLKNDETIVYDIAQCTIKYLIEIKK